MFSSYWIFGQQGDLPASKRQSAGAGASVLRVGRERHASRRHKSVRCPQWRAGPPVGGRCGSNDVAAGHLRPQRDVRFPRLQTGVSRPPTPAVAAPWGRFAAERRQRDLCIVGAERPAGSNGAETYAKPLDRAQRGPGISRHAGTGSSTGGSATSRGRAPTVAAVIGAPRGADAFTPAVSGIRAGSARAVPARSRPCWRSHRR
jgi:hypothetical protein